jgi:hypothetical protein
MPRKKSWTRRIRGMRYSKRSKGRAGRTVVLGGDDMVDGFGDDDGENQI